MKIRLKVKQPASLATAATAVSQESVAASGSQSAPSQAAVSSSASVPEPDVSQNLSQSVEKQQLHQHQSEQPSQQQTASTESVSSIQQPARNVVRLIRIKPPTAATSSVKPESSFEAVQQQQQQQQQQHQPPPPLHNFEPEDYFDNEDDYDDDEDDDEDDIDRSHTGSVEPRATVDNNDGYDYGYDEEEDAEADEEVEDDNDDDNNDDRDNAGGYDNSGFGSPSADHFINDSNAVDSMQDVHNDNDEAPPMSLQQSQPQRAPSRGGKARRGKRKSTGWTRPRATPAAGAGTGAGAGAGAAPGAIKDLTTLLDKALVKLGKLDVYGFFLRPVDTSAYPDYLAIIKQPMDLGTMRARLAADMYTNLAIFRHDFELVCRNSMAFNSPESIYHQAAQKLLREGDRIIERLQNRKLIFTPGQYKSDVPTLSTTGLIGTPGHPIDTAAASRRSTTPGAYLAGGSTSDYWHSSHGRYSHHSQVPLGAITAITRDSNGSQYALYTQGSTTFKLYNIANTTSTTESAESAQPAQSAQSTGIKRRIEVSENATTLKPKPNPNDSRNDSRNDGKSDSTAALSNLEMTLENVNAEHFIPPPKRSRFYIPYIRRPYDGEEVPVTIDGSLGVDDAGDGLIYSHLYSPYFDEEYRNRMKTTQPKWPLPQQQMGVDLPNCPHASEAYTESLAAFLHGVRVPPGLLERYLDGSLYKSKAKEA